MTKQNFCRRLLPSSFDIVFCRRLMTRFWDDLSSMIVPFSLVDRKAFYVGQPWRPFSALGPSVDL